MVRTHKLSLSLAAANPAHTLSDPAVKQIIMDMNTEHQFVIEDLDDTHLFVGNRSGHSYCIPRLYARP